MSKVQAKHFLLLLFIGIIWGSSFILMKRGLETFQPTDVAFIRLSLAFFAFIPIILFRKIKLKREQLPWIAIVAIIGTFIPSILFPYAQTQINSATSSIINSTTPIWTLLFGFLVFRNKVNAYKVLGIALGLVGVMAIMLQKTSSETENLNYGLIILLATSFYGFSTNVVREKLKEIDPISLTAATFLIAGPTSLLFLAFSEAPSILINEPGAWTSFGFIAILGIIGTALTNILFFGLIQKTSALFGAMVTYIIPIVGSIWGILDNEQLSIYHFLGFCCIIAGIYVSGRTPKPLKYQAV